MTITKQIKCNGCNEEIIPYSNDPRDKYYTVEPCYFKPGEKSGMYIQLSVGVVWEEYSHYCISCMNTMREALKKK